MDRRLGILLRRVGLLIGLAGIIAGGALATHGAPRYAEGQIYLDSAADTVSLKELGFRDFEFLGRSVHGVKYFARWPITASLDSLPAAVTGVEIEAIEGPEPVEWPVDTSTPAAKPTRPPTHLEQARADDRGGWLNGGPFLSLEEAQRTKSPDYRREWLEKEEALRVWNNSRTTGTFITSPTESGRYHKNPTHVNRDPQLTGNFGVAPVNRTAGLTLRNPEDLRPDFPLPSTGTFLTSPADTGRQEWRSIQTHPSNWPVIPTPPQYRGSIQVRH